LAAAGKRSVLQAAGQCLGQLWREKVMPETSAYQPSFAPATVSKFWNMYKSKTVWFGMRKRLDPAKLLNRQQLTVGHDLALALHFPLASERIH
jgi:hypothetical protein